MRWIASLLLVVGLSVPLSACGSSSPSSLPSSPKAVLASIVAAALAQKSVHWTRWVGEDMVGSFRSAADVNADSGIEREEFPVGTAEIRLVNGTIYIRGDVQGIEYALHLTPARSVQYAGQWISIPSNGGDEEVYDQLADGLTLSSIVHDATPLGTLTSHGKRLLVVQGTADGGVTTLVAQGSGNPLPASFRADLGPGDGITGRFSKWNEPVHVQAPATSTPIATVRG